MKKLLFLFISFIVSLFICTSVYAYDGLSKFQEDCASVGISPSDSWLETLDNTWSQNPDLKGAFFITSSTINGALSDDIRIANNIIYYGNGYFAYWASWASGVDVITTGSYGPVNGYTPIVYDSYEDASPTPIDYDNLYYSPNIHFRQRNVRTII